jgi:hypothetical protein
MIFSLLTIALIAGIGYVWSSRGLFSAFIHLFCVIAAGGIAFAVWEPVAYLLLEAGKGGFLTDIAWGTALAVPFALALAVLRFSIDALLPANLDFDSVTNLVGGGLCGLASGVITVGVLVLSLSSLRMSTEILGFRPVSFDNNGSLVRGSGGGFFRADELTARLYTSLSTSTFRPLSDEHLAFWRPDLADEGPLLRTNFNNGTSRHVLQPDAFEVLGRYTFAPGNAQEITRDSFDPRGTAQSFTFMDGTAGSGGNARVEGFVVRMRAGAREASGRVVVGNGQVRLIARSEADGRSIGIQPMAMISQASGDSPTLGRWRFDAANTYIASVGGRDDAPMAFEFMVPRGYDPVGLTVKGSRRDVRTVASARTFMSLAARDAAVRDGTITPTTAIGKLDKARAVTIDPTTGNDRSIRVGTSFPPGLMLQRDTTKDLTLGGEEKNQINGGGLSKFTRTEMQNQGADPKLLVRQFYRSEDTNLIQLTVDITNTQFGLLTAAAAEIDPAQPIVIIDSTGAPYTPIGYVYSTPTEIWLRYDAQRPVQRLNDMDGISLSRSQPDQRLTLIFRVSRGVQITTVAVGDKVLAEFKPPLEVPRN